MTGIRLESEAHIISGLTTSLKNTHKAVNDLGIELKGFVFSGLASAMAVATETEKELGVAVVDIGSDCSTICVYVEGCLEYSTSIPVGAKHITKDMAVGCSISLESAEKLKLKLSSKDFELPQPKPGESKEDLNRRRKAADKIDLEKLGIEEEGTKELARSKIIEGIMIPRIKEIFTLIGTDLEKNNLLNLIPAGVVIAGGGAETVSMVETAKRTLNLPARIGKPRDIEGVTSDLVRPAFATSLGLVEYAMAQGAIGESKKSVDFSSVFKGLGNINLSGMGDFGEKIKKILKSIIP